MNIHRIKNCLTLTFDDGSTLTTNECTDEFYDEVLKIKDDKTALIELFHPSAGKALSLKERLSKSKYMTIDRNNSIYIKSISKLTVPQNFAEKLIEAEETNNADRITAYLNFWTLLSLNPNSAVRDNLFWFLDKWGMSICKSGLFVAYRNVELKEQGVQYNQALTAFVSENYYNIKNHKGNPKDYNVVVDNYDNYSTIMVEADTTKLVIGNLATLYENIVLADDKAGTVYTDNYTRKMEIRLGHIVSIPRSQCDESQISCSRGLHCGARGWLKNNYYGNIGLKVLVNPSNVCSVPREDNYGKMRTCAYYPIQVIKFNDEGDVDDDIVPDGFEVDFMSKICYDGVINNEDNDNYRLDIPTVSESERILIYKNLKQLALNCMSNRN